MSALMCSGPISRWSNFIAEKNGRSGHPVQRPKGRAGISAASRSAGTSGASRTGALVVAPPGAFVVLAPTALEAATLAAIATSAAAPDTDAELALGAAPPVAGADV